MVTATSTRPKPASSTSVPGTIALLVEHAVVGQQDLAGRRRGRGRGGRGRRRWPGRRGSRSTNPTTAAVSPTWAATRSAAARLAARNDGEDQVLGRVAGQGQLGEHDQVGALAGRLGIGGKHLLDVAVEVPDDRVDLRPREPQPLHAPRVAACNRAHGRPAPTPGSRQFRAALATADPCG